MNSSTPSPRTIVFDLDGTLSDPADGIGRSFDFALTAFGYPPLPAGALSRYIGPPLDRSFRIITGAQDEALVARLVAKYRERYAQVGYAENTMYPGIPEALEALAQRGHRLGVCTSKRVDFAEQILELFGIRARFEFVSGGETGVAKDHQLAQLLRRGAIDARALMVGDRAFDIDAARANGLDSAGVLWGHGSREELVTAGAGRLLERVEELRMLAG